MLYLFEIWYWKQLLESGEKFRHQSFKCCVEVRAILHRKDILSDYKKPRQIQHISLRFIVVLHFKHSVM